MSEGIFLEEQIKTLEDILLLQHSRIDDNTRSSGRTMIGIWYGNVAYGQDSLLLVTVTGRHDLSSVGELRYRY